MNQILDFFLHLDEKLIQIVGQYGTLTYVLLFLVIFAETGLVVTPFLPGDSLIFAAGTIAAAGALNIIVLWLVLCAAAILGDSINYAIGHFIGVRLFASNNRVLKKILKKEYLDRTHAFYEKHGGVTIILARFIPIIRTFAPFVAGVGAMTYSHFIVYNVIGGILWVTLFLSAGYLFGGLPFVQNNFELVVIAIILISVMPMVIEYLRSRGRSETEVPVE
jgi:membrane-associated protein